MCNYDDVPMYLKDLSKDEKYLIFKYRIGDEETRQRILEAVFSDDYDEEDDSQSNAKEE